MKSRAARLGLLVLFVMALGVTAYLFRKSETAKRAEAAAGDRFNAQARTVARHILDLRAAQQAYVATGQGEDFWAARVAKTLASLREGLPSLRAAALSPDARSGVDAASGALQDFAQMDSRAREYMRTSQKLLASDMIFSNGSELTETAVAAIDKAADAEVLARAAAGATFERRQTFALIAAAAAGGLVMLLLLPGVESELPAPAFLDPRPPAQALTARAKKVDAVQTSPEIRVVPTRTSGIPSTAGAATTDPSPAGEPAPSDAMAAADNGSSTAPDGGIPALDFKAVAALCTEFSRVDDTTALPPLLERAASVLEAAGIILWIADPEGRELTPVLAHGYPQHLVNRLGAIPRAAENATAAAFRTGQLQTVFADGGSNGAIAAPLITGGGCVGVMAAEVRGDTERLEANLAAATILAAQLASLVGPTAHRSSDPAIEAANA